MDSDAGSAMTTTRFGRAGGANILKGTHDSTKNAPKNRGQVHLNLDYLELML